MRNTSREENRTPIGSLKSTTANALSNNSAKENDSHSILEQRRLMAGTPCVEKQMLKLSPNYEIKKRSGSGDKNNK